MKRNEGRKKPVLKKKDSPNKIISKNISPKNNAPGESKPELQLDDIKLESNKIEPTVIQAPKPTRPTFIPQIYRFHLPGGNYSTEDTNSAETPPFWLLLDHTLGVIWSLFSSNPQRTKLGVSQLQWALEFLKGIRTLAGDNPKDVKICIQAIEDKLIELYAKISSSIDKDVTTSKTINSMTNKSQHLSPMKSEAIVNGLRRKSTSLLSMAGLTDNSIKGSTRSIIKSLQPPYPLSVTYEEVLSRSPKSVQQLYKAEPKSISKSDVITEENCDIEESKSNTSVSHNKLLDFLTDWRREQVNRIQNELKRLHSIEEFIGTMEKDNFQPFIDESVAQRLFKINATMDTTFTSLPKSEQVKPADKKST